MGADFIQQEQCLEQQWNEIRERKMEPRMKVYAAINAVQADLAKSGIGKDRKNQAQGYAFRGIDDVYNVVSPLLARHGLCILPRMLARQCEERTNAKGTALFYVTVEAAFDFVSSEDGSKHVCSTFGEAMDSGDKATNKAMSAAYKYAVMQAFAIPTEGDNDADAVTHDVAPKVSTTPMTTSAIADHLSAITAADTLDDLKAAYGTALRAAKAANDTAAADQFYTAKENCKAALACATQ